MNSNPKYFDKNSKYINLLVNDKEILEKYKLKVYSKMNLILNQCIMINILKLK